jgi:uncharacterized protein (TIGR01244 family)
MVRSPPLLATILWLALAPSPAAAAITCTGSAAGHPCHAVDLLAHLDLAALGYGNLNDIWGWTDPLDGREYALVGAVHGTVFVDVTDPEAPRIVGRLPAHEELASGKLGAPGAPQRQPLCKALAGSRSPQDEEGGCAGGSSWRDLKVYADHAFIVSEASGHGMQVFDLRQLRAFPSGSAVQVFGETARYAGFGNAHNLAIDEASGFAYAVGSNTAAGGLHAVDIRDPANPVAAGSFAADGYTHDAHCVVYAGPDLRYSGRQLCFASNEDTLTVVDVTTKTAMVQVSRTGYDGAAYTHQGWLSADHRYLFVDDELDELQRGTRTRTLVWDLADLQRPAIVDRIDKPRFNIDHNNYYHQGFLYQSDYTAGLVVLDARDPRHAFEVGWFDTHPADDAPQFDGSWSNYPFFASGVVAVSDITRGLYLLRPTLPAAAGASDAWVSVSLDASASQALLVIDVGGSGRLLFSASVDGVARLRWDQAAISPGTLGATVLKQEDRAVTLAFDLSAGNARFTVPVDAPGAQGFTTDAVVMVGGSGLDPDPTNNRVVQRVSQAAVVGGGGGGGGGAAGAAALAALLLATAWRRRLVLGLALAAGATLAADAPPLATLHARDAMLATSAALAEGDAAALAAAGFEVVVDLRTPAEGLEAEQQAVTAAGLEYRNLPVERADPKPADLAALSALLASLEGRKVLVHCATNKRAAAMVMLDQVTRRGASRAEAEAWLHEVWTPNPVWQGFIDRTLSPQAIEEHR